MYRHVGYGTIVSLALICATMASASERQYFYKASVSRDQYTVDRFRCLNLSGQVTAQGPGTLYVQNNPNLTSGQNAMAVGLASIFAGMMRSSATRQVANMVERTCMADRGYLRYRVDDAFADQLEAIASPEARVDAYYQLATSAQPVGERMPE